MTSMKREAMGMRQSKPMHNADGFRFEFRMITHSALDTESNFISVIIN